MACTEEMCKKTCFECYKDEIEEVDEIEDCEEDCDG